MKWQFKFVVLFYGILTIMLASCGSSSESSSSDNNISKVSTISTSPSATFARVGQVGPTIPDPLTVTLAEAASVDTFIPVTSSNITALTIPNNGVTVPAGSTSAQLSVEGLSQALEVNVTATLGVDTATSSIRVVDPSETPQLTSLTSSADTVSLGGAITMTIMLDLPAPAGGTFITLSTDNGTVPSSVTVLQDNISINFTYTADSATGIATITAMTTTSSISAQVTVN